MDQRTAQNQGQALSLLFGIGHLFLAVGLFVSWIYFTAIVDWWRAQSWEEVPCGIASAALLESGSDTTTYKVVAEYQYAYAGVTYQASRVSFSHGSDNIGSYHQDIYRELSAHLPSRSGAPFRCFVNPSKPSESVLYRTFRWEMGVFLGIFVLTFPAVGVGLVLGGRIGMNLLKEEAQLAARYPDMQWKWKSEWASASIPEANRRLRRAVVAYTLWYGLVLLPVLFASARSGALEGGQPPWPLAIFAVLWLIPIWHSVKYLCLRWSVGDMRFEPRAWPWSPGGTVEGHFLLNKPLPAREAAKAVLSCTKFISRGTGENRSTAKERIWTQSQPVPLDGMTRDLMGFRLPVSFTIPSDAPPVRGGEDDGERITWQLEFHVSPTPVHAQFEIPVFHTAKSAPSGAVEPTNQGIPAVSRSIHEDASLDLSARLAACGITADFDANGLPIAIACPAARFRPILLLPFGFTVVWTGMAALLLHVNAPLLFRIVWPLSAAALWVGLGWMISHSRDLRLDSSGLRIVTRLGSLASWQRSYKKSEIVGFSLNGYSSFGRIIYNRIRLTVVGGNQHIIVNGITDSATAEILEQRLTSWKSEIG